MGDCSTSQPKCTGARSACPTARRVLEKEEPLPDQASTQARLEGKDSIVQFLRRTATGNPEREREYVRPHIAEEEVDSQTSTEEQNPHMERTHLIYLQE
ncbi:hypothetical protein NDU88_004454 [Pleurodeles waltl]|uniref:Uncharacterized protein n=1 Tax=Pleurodeles waltl TaxID=8319 RepID=A0AAV7LJW6_PLEWA|nr:hypothetical protein NDU88_004454 [Pleurodeles waltl]